MTKTSIALLLAALAALTAPSGAVSHRAVAQTCARESKVPLICQVRHYRLGTWKLQDQMGQSRTPTRFRELTTDSIAFKGWIRDLWHGRYHKALKAWHAFQTSFLNWSAWDRLAACETGGNWGATGPTYQGGLGIQYQVWAEFGGYQFASNAGYATREEQIIVGHRIWLRYGWSPWGCAGQVGLL